MINRSHRQLLERGREVEIFINVLLPHLVDALVRPVWLGLAINEHRPHSLREVGVTHCLLDQVEVLLETLLEGLGFGGSDQTVDDAQGKGALVVECLEEGLTVDALVRVEASLDLFD